MLEISHVFPERFMCSTGVGATSLLVITVVCYPLQIKLIIIIIKKNTLPSCRDM